MTTLKYIGAALAAIVLLIYVPVGGALYYFAHLERPDGLPTVNAVALGKTYAVDLAACYADAADLMAKDVESGTPLDKAQADMQKAWQDARQKAFLAHVAPEFSRVVPEETKALSPAQQAAFAKLWRDFAKGLRGGK